MPNRIGESFGMFLLKTKLVCQYHYLIIFVQNTLT